MRVCTHTCANLFGCLSVFLLSNYGDFFVAAAAATIFTCMNSHFARCSDRGSIWYTADMLG